MRWRPRLSDAVHVPLRPAGTHAYVISPAGALTLALALTLTLTLTLTCRPHQARAGGKGRALLVLQPEELTFLKYLKQAKGQG